MKINKTILKALLLASFIISSVAVKSQEEFNSSKSWGVELQSYTVGTFVEFNFNLEYRQNKNAFYVGTGFSKHFNYKTLEPVLQIGYRRYPGQNLQPLKFYYQTFLYYSSRHNKDTDKISNRYVTGNVGVGLDYDFTKKLTIGLNTNIGWGPDFIKHSGAITLIPLQLSLSCKI